MLFQQRRDCCCLGQADYPQESHRRPGREWSLWRQTMTHHWKTGHCSWPGQNKTFPADFSKGPVQKKAGYGSGINNIFLAGYRYPKVEVHEEKKLNYFARKVLDRGGSGFKLAHSWSRIRSVADPYPGSEEKKNLSRIWIQAELWSCYGCGSGSRHKRY